jgi:hypothetical protein
MFIATQVLLLLFFFFSHDNVGISQYYYYFTWRMVDIYLELALFYSLNKLVVAPSCSTELSTYLLTEYMALYRDPRGKNVLNILRGSDL